MYKKSLTNHHHIYLQKKKIQLAENVWERNVTTPGKESLKGKRKKCLEIL